MSITKKSKKLGKFYFLKLRLNEYFNKTKSAQWANLVKIGKQDFITLI